MFCGTPCTCKNSQNCLNVKSAVLIEPKKKNVGGPHVTGKAYGWSEFKIFTLKISIFQNPREKIEKSAQILFIMH